MKESSLPDLRKVSREEYLRKREAQKLEELKESLEDEKTLFQGVELSEKEKRDIAYRRPGVRAGDRADSGHRLDHGGPVPFALVVR